MTEPTSAQDLFRGRLFDQEIIVLCIRWYLTFKLSSRDLVQMMAERGIALAHTTILRWAQRYVPDFEKRWNQYARPVGDSWRVDDTYIKVKGQWVYLYRAVDKQGRTVDFLLSKRRDVAAAKQFFCRATKQHGAPRMITLDGYAASHRAVAKLKEVGTLPRRVRIRSSQYLNNVVEHDHRRIKQRIRPMLGFKRFETATVTICGIRRRIGLNSNKGTKCEIGIKKRNGAEPATPRLCHYKRLPICLVRRPPSGTLPSFEQISQPQTTLMNWRFRDVGPPAKSLERLPSADKVNNTVSVSLVLDVKRYFKPLWKPGTCWRREANATRRL